MSNESLLESKLSGYSQTQQFMLALMRVVVGWHFLYEGYVIITY